MRQKFMLQLATVKTSLKMDDTVDANYSCFSYKWELNLIVD